MRVEPEAFEKRMDRFREGLRRAGVKLTHQRLEIFQEVARSGAHPDAETVFKGVRKSLPTVSLDTVYRTLWLLLDLGLLSTLGPLRERVRFDANINAHHHFVCKRCGMTQDFYIAGLDDRKIRAAVKTLGRAEKTQVEVTGLCLHCSKKIGG